MQLFKVAVKFVDETIQSTVKAGILASAQVSYKKDGVMKPHRKVNLVVGLYEKLPAAWVQVLEFNGAGEAIVTHEGWINSRTSSLESLGKSESVSATVEEVSSPTPEMIKCQESAVFGAKNCCTYNGTNCTLTCCGGCCSTSSCGSCCP